jgi:hypothetical protein
MTSRWRARRDSPETIGREKGEPMDDRTVTIEINQQQERMLDRLTEEGSLGSTHGEVVRSGFVRFCEKHPEFFEDREGRDDG